MKHFNISLVSAFFILSSVLYAQDRGVSLFDCPVVICGDTVLAAEKPVCLLVEKEQGQTRNSIAISRSKLQVIRPDVVRYWIRIVHTVEGSNWYYSVELDCTTGAHSLYRAVRLDRAGRSVEEVPVADGFFSAYKVQLQDAEEAICRLLSKK